MGIVLLVTILVMPFILVPTLYFQHKENEKIVEYCKEVKGRLEKQGNEYTCILEEKKESTQ